MIGTQDNGLTLEGLAQRLDEQGRENAERLEALERENTELRSKLATLEDSVKHRGKVSALRGSDTRHSGEAASAASDGRISRRSVFSKAGAVAVAAMAAGTLLYPREAKAGTDFFDVIEAKKVLVFNGDELTSLSAFNTHDASALYAESTSASNAAIYGNNKGSGPGVEGTAQGNLGYGVRGTGSYGVWGESNQSGFYGVTGRNTNTDGTGVRGVTSNTDGRAGVRGEGATGVWGSSPKTGYSGVYGQHTGTAGYGVVGDGKGSTGAGVLGRNGGGEGVRGEGSTTAEVAGVRGLGKTGVWGSSATTGYSGVYGQHTGQGPGVVGDGRGSTSAGVLGRNSSGYGGQFDGGKAQLILKPKGGTAGKPTTGTHLKGEISMDSAATLWVCTDSGTPGKWRKVATTAA